MATETYRAQHARLRDLIALLGAQLAPDATRAGAMREALTKVSGFFEVHAAAEDKLYARLMGAGKPADNEVARKFQREMALLKRSFDNHSAKWSRTAIAAKPAAFVKETEAMIGQLGERMDREEREIFAILEAASGPAT